jgi:hypothetical protein
VTTSLRFATFYRDVVMDSLRVVTTWPSVVTLSGEFVPACRGFMTKRRDVVTTSRRFVTEHPCVVTFLG